MTAEYLTENKTYYEGKHKYFNNLGFDTLATDFKKVVDLIGEMENYIKEKENGKEV